jgi:hypothetical protein
MPRVTTHTKNKGGHKVYHCTGPCKVAEERDGDSTIRPGDRYYQWSRRFGRSGATYFKHVACGRPKPTQLSSRKTAQVEEAIEDATLAGSDTPEIDWDDVTAGGTLELPQEDLESTLQGVAEEARNVGEEYTSGADNMPESLQYGQQAEAMREVGQELEGWADNLDSWQPSCETEITVPDDYDGSDDAKAVVQGLWDEAWEALCQDAQDHLDGDSLPEYQG